jgi:hypothetical protein
MTSEFRTPLGVIYLDYDGVLHHEAIHGSGLEGEWATSLREVANSRTAHRPLELADP